MKIRFFLLVIFLSIILILNITLGSVIIPIKTLTSVVLFNQQDSAYHSIVWLSRIPQLITACFVGISLAISGSLLQTLFRNSLAGPSVLGISSGASLGIACALLLGQYGLVINTYTSLFFSIIGSFIVLLIIVQISHFIKQSHSLLIVGLMIGYFSSSITSVFQYFSNKETLQLFSLWGLGSFANVSWEQMPFFLSILILFSVSAFFLMKPLNALLLGENYAYSLGVNLKKIRLAILLITGVLTGVCTAFCGPIAFLGLAVPHLTRLLFRTSNHFVLLPAICLVGANFALFCNLISRLPYSQYTLPINAITSFIGAPIVVFLIFKQIKK